MLYPSLQFESITLLSYFWWGWWTIYFEPCCWGGIDVEVDVMAVAGVEDFAVLASSEGWIDVEGDVMCVVSNVGS